MILASKETVSKAAIVGCLLSPYSMGSLSCSSLIIIIINEKHIFMTKILVTQIKVNLKVSKQIMFYGYFKWSDF